VRNGWLVRSRCARIELLRTLLSKISLASRRSSGDSRRVRIARRSGGDMYFRRAGRDSAQ
jgi:hypothetical protein